MDPIRKWLDRVRESDRTSVYIYETRASRQGQFMSYIMKSSSVLLPLLAFHCVNFFYLCEFKNVINQSIKNIMKRIEKESIKIILKRK